MEEHRGKWLLAVSVAMALALAALIYFLFVVHPPEERQNASTIREDQASTAAAIPRFKVTPPTPLAADERDLCGYGRVKQNVAEDIRDKAEEAGERILSGLKTRLAASQDPREAAFGLYLLGSTEELAKLASNNRDPQVYGLAFLSCHYGSTGTCALLSVEQWANLEPDNAAPWLLIANAAQSAMAREEAVYKASAAQRFDARLPDFFGLLALPDIRSQAPQTRSAVEDELVGLQMTLPGFPYQPAYRFCNYPSLADVGHRDICSNLAKLFLERDRTIIGLAVGAKLAQSAGWSPDAVNSLRERSARLREAFAAGVKQQTERAASDCDELAAFERWAANYSNLGDRGVATKYLEESTARGPAERQ